MHVALVAMPWGAFFSPSAALGALTAYGRNADPSIQFSSHSEFLKVAMTLGVDLYRSISDRRGLAETLYLGQLYPERRDGIAEFFEKILLPMLGRDAPSTLRKDVEGWRGLFQWVDQTLADHIEEAARQLAQADVVGLTTSIAQVFSSIAIARRIKAINPNTVIVLGGAGVLGAAGRSLLDEYSWIDFVVQGEGERTLLALLKGLQAKLCLSAVPGLLGREHGVSCCSRTDMEDLDALPIPDHAEYAELAENFEVLWTIPLEGSRGCWWDRVAQTGNPKDKCHFCNYANQSYRTKSPARLVAEMDELAERYRNVRFALTDNAMWPSGLCALSEGIRGRGKDFVFFGALRVNLKPADLLALKRAGVVQCECGIEGFSTRYLRRLNKGTSVILNLQALKTCDELGLRNNTNLITGFPGTSQEEVDESAAVVRRYAIAYRPTMRLIPFLLTPGSAVHAFPHEFGVGRVLQPDFYGIGLPEDVFQRIQINELQWEASGLQADWSDLEQACAEWRALHAQLAADQTLPFHHPLYYHDGGTFLEIIDRRHGYRAITLEGPWRSIYLFCADIHAREEVLKRFSPAAEVREALDTLVSEELMFQEEDRVLSLAVAPTPDIAERRIVAAQSQG